MDEAKLLRLWGKSDDDDPLNWHPLLFHLLDVGFVTMRLWDDVLTPRLRRRIAISLGFPESDTGIADARRVVILIAAQHDLGKASAFQTKVEHLWKEAQSALGLSFSIAQPPTPPHGFVTTKLIQTMASDIVGGWSAPAAVRSILARVAGRHHGKFPVGADLINPEYVVATGNAVWDDIRTELLGHLHRHLFPGSEVYAATRVESSVLRDAAIVPMIGGLISVADWIGSSQEYFSPAGKHSHSIGEYAKISQTRAETALRDIFRRLERKEREQVSLPVR